MKKLSSEEVNYIHVECITTGGGSGNKEGTMCQFPFMYQDKIYSSCTDVDHHTSWCFTEEGATEQAAWGTCTLCQPGLATTCSSAGNQVLTPQADKEQQRNVQKSCPNGKLTFLIYGYPLLRQSIISGNHHQPAT